MRSVETSLLVYTSAGQVTGAGSARRTLQASEASILEAELNAQLAEFDGLPGTWVLTHLELAGAGDGDAFLVSTEWANTTVLTESTGLDPAGATVVFFQGSGPGELVRARQAAQLRFAARIEADEGGTEVQTGLAGAAKGNQLMGFMLGVIS